MAVAALPAGGIDNILLCADSYKATHHLQYPPNTTTVYSYFESRGGKFPETLFFGLQYILKRWLVGPVVTYEKIAEAKDIFQAHFEQGEVFNEEGWKYIVKEHGGKLPIQIKAVPEGTLVPTKNVLFTVENTDPKCYWLTNYVETLLVQVWYPMTVATNSYHQKKVIADYLKQTADGFATLPFQLHDFGFRGVSSVESAGIGGMAHLVNFKGTDTVASLMTARRYYNCNMAGFSVPAAEHSTITSWGKDGEKAAFKNMLDRIPEGTISVVSDSYDIYNACENVWGKELKDCVIKRGENKGVLVIRPDSGKPEEVVVRVLDILGSKFGTEKNSKGFKKLPPYLRVIQGDGINLEKLTDVLKAMKKSEWSAENIVFGSGGALLQKLDRDTQKCAYKCSFAVVSGESVNVYKDPVTDHGKKSKKGRLSLVKDGSNKYVTKEECQVKTESNSKKSPSKETQQDLLVTVFKDGQLLKDYTLDEIRNLAELDEVKKAKK